MSEQTDHRRSHAKHKHTAGLFDIRIFIARPDRHLRRDRARHGVLRQRREQLDKADGLNINLWPPASACSSVSALFIAWARLAADRGSRDFEPDDDDSGDRH